MTSEERYLNAARRLQTGVATDQGLGSSDGTPKNLRVGVNIALAGQASLARLLIRKGLITQEEYSEALAEGIEAEVAGYEARLSAITGRKIILGEAGFGADPV